MSDTPETDAAVHASGGDWSPVLRAVSQRLERERDKAIRQLDNLNATAIHSCHSECQRPMCVLRRERDEEMKWHHRTHKELVETQCKLMDITRERDEANEQVKELIYIAGRAIDLAEIDYENDKFGVVSELRDGLEKIKSLNTTFQKLK